jgi:hypothetical protein
MKKLLLGCLGVSVILVIAGGVLGYFYVYKPAKSFVAGVSQFGEVNELNAQIENKTSFVPPDGNLLTQAMVDRYMSTQQSLRDRMGPRIAELETKYKKFENNSEQQASIGEVLGAIQDLGTLILEAKRAQVASLNEHQFSLDEYEWVRRTMYEAVGVPLGTTFQDALRQAGADAGGTTTTPSMGFTPSEVPEANRLLVEPHAQKLKDNVALAFFGL